MTAVEQEVENVATPMQKGEASQKDVCQEDKNVVVDDGKVAGEAVENDASGGKGKGRKGKGKGRKGKGKGKGGGRTKNSEDKKERIQAARVLNGRDENQAQAKDFLEVTSYQFAPLFAEEDAKNGTANAKEQFLESLTKPLPVTIRIDFTKPFAEAVVLPTFQKRGDWKCRSEFGDNSVWECENEPYEADKDFKRWVERECRRGALSFQEIVSMLPVYALDIKSNHHVLDLCAAPGSKATLASQMLDKSTANPSPAFIDGPEGLVVGCDSDLNRACKVLPRNMANTRSTTTAACLLNSKKLGQLLEASTRDDGWKERFPFHKIMADVPCSGDGTIRKNMTIWTSWNRKYSYVLFPTQLKILLRGLFLLEEGEELCYSTCSLNPIENECVVQVEKFEKNVKNQ